MSNIGIHLFQGYHDGGDGSYPMVWLEFAVGNGAGKIGFRPEAALKLAKEIKKNAREMMSQKLGEKA